MINVDDIYVMAYLLARGHRITDTDVQNGRVSVTFEGENLSKEISGYYTGTVIPAINYVENFKRAKSIVFEKLNEKENGNGK